MPASQIPPRGGQGGVEHKTTMSRRKIIPYNPNLTALSRQLRNNSTLSEVLLWNQIKGKQLRGYQFLRQKPIGNYIVDFFCYQLMLAIEIDGESHNYNVDKHGTRQNHLASVGISVIRFLDVDVKGNMEGVLLSLNRWIDAFELNNG
jgi:very-short-patch-repair endonuclease